MRSVRETPPGPQTSPAFTIPASLALRGRVPAAPPSPRLSPAPAGSLSSGPGPSPLAGLPGAPSPLPQPGRAAATLTGARVPGSGPGAPPPAQQRPRGVQAHGAALLLHPEHRAQRLRRPHRARRPGRRLLGRAAGARGAEGRGTVSGPLEPAGARRRRRRGAGGARAGGRRCVTPYAGRPRAPRRGRGQRARPARAAGRSGAAGRAGGRPRRDRAQPREAGRTPGTRRGPGGSGGGRGGGGRRTGAGFRAEEPRRGLRGGGRRRGRRAAEGPGNQGRGCAGVEAPGGRLSSGVSSGRGGGGFPWPPTVGSPGAWSSVAPPWPVVGTGGVLQGRRKCYPVGPEGAAGGAWFSGGCGLTRPPSRGHPGQRGRGHPAAFWIPVFSSWKCKPEDLAGTLGRCGPCWPQPGSGHHLLCFGGHLRDHRGASGPPHS